ncbi:MAG: hypothetical protein CSA58_11635 [Micrococcales bacterium]|nr:MAG: hypothetical protein CSA58_11635 [Micrococcales bacterium]
MSDPLVLRHDQDGVVRLTLNAADRYNPLSRSMIGALQVELDRVRDDPSARVVVLAGAGRGFSAGHDLGEMIAHTGDLAWQQALFEECNARVVGADELDTQVLWLARTIASHSAGVLANGKRTFYTQADQPVAQAYRTAAAGMIRDLSCPDAAEGMAAFLDKRAPQRPSAVR